MSFVEVRLVGENHLERDLALFGEKARTVFSRAVQEAAASYRDHTKRMAPVSASRTGYGAKGVPVDTGRLRQSIQSRNLALLAAGVGPRVNYGEFVHEGTRRMPARPFLQWSLESGAMDKIDAVFRRASSLLP